MAEELTERLQRLQREFDEVQASIPAHSLKASHLQRLEDLEDEIDELKKAIAAKNGMSKSETRDG